MGKVLRTEQHVLQIHDGEIQRDIEFTTRLTDVGKPKKLFEMAAVGEFVGAPMQLALPPDIDVDRLNKTSREALGVPAKFVTLPVGQFSAESRNGWTYSPNAVKDMVAQVNAFRREGRWGHLSWMDMDSKYDPPAIRWMVADIDSDGVAWGKLIPLTRETYDYYMMAEATNALVGTSLYAWAESESDVITTLDLISIDIAEPPRVGILMTVAKPMITSDMSNDPPEEIEEETSEEEEQEDPASGQEEPQLEGDEEEPDKENLEMTKELQEQVETLRAQNAELAGSHQIVQTLETLLGTSDIVSAVESLQASRRSMLQTVAKAKVEEACKVPAVRKTVLRLVNAREFSTTEELDAVIAEEMKSEEVQELLAAGLQSEMGPNVKNLEGGGKKKSPFIYPTDKAANA